MHVLLVLQVVLTDYEDQVVDNLRTCMHMNTAAAAAAASQQQQGSPTAAAGAQSHALDDLFGGSTDEDEQQQQQPQQAVDVPDDAELFDDADSVDDLDLSAMLTGRSSSGTAAAAGSSSSRDPAAAVAAAAAGLTAWEADNMLVRLLDWQESADALEAAERGEAPPPAAATAASEQQQAGSSCSSSQPDRAPVVPLQQQFPVILANEVMYEPAHAQLVAAAIRHRLVRGGRALLCCAVRDQAVFDMFRDSCRRWGLRYRALKVQPGVEDLGGIRGRERDYEGGFLLMAVDHADAPADDWHRDDFEVVV
jgi:hypothetical protein